MKICIVANNAYGALTGEDSGHIGGVERQTALLAEWLTAKGHQVSIITWDEGGEKIEDIGGIRVIKLCKVSDGLPGFRFLMPRWSSLISALKKADAELYYHNCAEYVTGQVAIWCKANKKPFIYTVASDADCEIDLPNLKSKREELLFRHGLQQANLVITQTSKQQALLKQNYDIDARVINMPATPPNYLAEFSRSALFSKQKVIWVGRLHKVKRLEWLFDIAQRLPNIQFEVIGPADGKSSYNQALLTRLAECNNIDYLGKVSRYDMPKIYQNASLLCCTSIYEGFPNTYLEAWSYGVPVITTIDPDNVINNNQLGFHAKSQDDFVNAIPRLISEQVYWQTCSTNCANYYTTNHEQNTVMAKFEQAFNSLLSQAIKSYFDKQSSTWADYYSDTQLSVSHLDLQHRLNHTSTMLKTIPKPAQTAKLLDLGCGTGNSFKQINHSGDWHITGVDISEAMVNSAKQQYPELNLSVANATQLPFAESTFATVVALGVIEYIAASNTVLSEIKRVLNHNGDLIISIPNQSSIFRKLRKIESVFTVPIKQLIHKIITKTEYKQAIFHQQWQLSDFIDKLQIENINVKQVNYCSYALLSPKLEQSAWNIQLCQKLTLSINTTSWLNKYLANTIIIHAKVEQS